MNDKRELTAYTATVDGRKTSTGKIRDKRYWIETGYVISGDILQVDGGLVGILSSQTPNCKNEGVRVSWFSFFDPESGQFLDPLTTGEAK